MIKHYIALSWLVIVAFAGFVRCRKRDPETWDAIIRGLTTVVGACGLIYSIGLAITTLLKGD